MENSSKVLLWAITFSILLAIVATYYIFVVEKNFYFSLEAPCSPTVEKCFYRDCSTGECPPNNLEFYRVFEVAAYDFIKCKDSSCLDECESGRIECVEYKCQPENDQSCSSYDDTLHNNKNKSVDVENKTNSSEIIGTTSVINSEENLNEIINVGGVNNVETTKDAEN